MLYVLRHTLPVLGSSLLQAPNTNEHILSYLMRHSLFNGLLIVGYLIIVLRWGPKFMRNRKPFQLRTVMLAYNAGQVVFNGILSAFTMYAILQQGYPWSCIRHDTLTATCLRFSYVNKYLDLLDTVIFVLRKKDKQVSFLHVYHHVMIIVACVTAMNLHEGGITTLVMFLNCIVHTAMYAYYFASSYDKDMLMNSAFIKKRITQMQLVQFMLISLQFGRSIFGFCESNLIFSICMFIQNAFITSLFLDFYLRTYGATL